MSCRRSRLAGAAIAGILRVAALCALLATAGVLLAASKPKVHPGSNVARTVELSIKIDGPPVAIVARQPGRLVRLAFQAKAGDRVDLGISGLKMSPASASALIATVRGPGDERVATERIHCFASTVSDPQGNCDGEISILASGRHTLELDPPFSAAASYTVLLSRPVAGTLGMDAPQEVRLRRIGQDARLALQLQDGDVSVEARHAASPQGDGKFRLKAFRSDGTLAATAEGSAERGASMPLSGAGGYIIEIDPDHGALGAFTLATRAAPTLALDGAPVSFATSNPSEVARIAFDGHAGQGIVVAVDGLTHAPDVESNSVLSIVQPDGSRLTGFGCTTRPIHGLRVVPCKLVVPSLPVSGRYGIAVLPPPHATVSGRVVAAPILSGTLSPGATLALPPMRQAQVANYTFDAKAGDVVGVDLTDVSTAPAGTLVSVTLKGPGGGGWLSSLAGRDAVRIKPRPLQVTGTYSVLIDTGLGTLTSGQLTLVAGEGKFQ